MPNSPNIWAGYGGSGRVAFFYPGSVWAVPRDKWGGIGGLVGDALIKRRFEIHVLMKLTNVVKSHPQGSKLVPVGRHHCAGQEPIHEAFESVQSKFSLSVYS